IELRKRVLDFIDAGGRKTDAAVLFQVNRSTIYEWLKRPKLEPSQRSKCDRKLKKEELLAHVEAHPDALQRERAVHFGVHRSTISAALKVLNIRKKNDALCGEKPQEKSGLSEQTA
ncbi:IS630 transposase-related protein, partial [Magnetococcus sp. PR-3]|uniref:IS630 transposase-related protein n=1 Tax=Magnetococcus sp. PR-3 TaxID=3120355 RepID=UPI002FCE1596